ncbi:conserved hypothetical protein [uncultured delta proteobacterium]|uniref:Uncharacterized protein n=1 Tax=uncultured delta proteobacterium TaxID=34034 RepID=A0A212J816_9DELT|nr:conserved hypothetical protein [uncultured delta proteobacterium]
MDGLMRQGSLFDLLPPENPDEAIGLAGMMPSVRAEMNRVAASYEPGRKLLVDAIIKVAQREAVALTPGGAKTIDPATLDKWLQSLDRGHAPNWEAVICFCLATGTASPIKPILKYLGLTAIPESDLEDLEYGKLCKAERKLRERKKALEARS